MAAAPLFAAPELPGFVERNDAWVFDDPFPDQRPRATGLQHRFPEMPGRAENPITPKKVELGRLLFFDPIVSGDNSMSCATCHHPDLGLADGRPLGMGVGGEGFGPDRKGGRDLPRNTPSLWNSAFGEWQFWDGRVRTLEEQASIPITHADEMNEDPARLVGELREIPEYVERFAAAFEEVPEEAVTFENAVAALSSFERTLVSANSKFDRYAAGDFDALNASEKNGLKLFRSLETRCFECHSFPTFSDGSFRVIGVPDKGESDLGRGATSERAANHSFKVPSLRNVELTAPYMHNGSLPTLEEVVKFYSEGGGRREAEPVPMIDDKIQKFDLMPEESADLVAFLKALTDTSLQPVAPSRVPSGLPVVAVESSAVPAPPLPAPPAAGRTRSGGATRVVPDIRLPPGAERPLEIIPTGVYATPASGSAPAATFHVSPGQSIQSAVDRSRPGDRIELAPGIYPESVEIHLEHLTITGPSGEGQRAILDGGGTFDFGIRTFAPKLKLSHLTLRNFAEAGLVAEQTEMPEIDDLLIEVRGP